MEQTFILTGLGGQGVKLAGEILCYAACKVDGLFTTNYALYGKQKRGGKSDCYVAISDEIITAPVFWQGDYVIAFTTETPESPADKLRPDSVLLMNSSRELTGDMYGTENFYLFDAEKFANEAENPKGINMVIIGVIVGFTDILPEDVVLETIFEKLGAKHPEFNEANERAYRLGLAQGKKFAAERAAKAN